MSVHFAVTTLFKYKTTFEVRDPPARSSHHVMALGGTVPYFIDLGHGWRIVETRGGAFTVILKRSEEFSLFLS